MARLDNLENYLSDVATAIRTKKGIDELIPAKDFDTEILNLPSGGGGETNVYRVKTLEERDAITTAKEGDICIVIDGSEEPITKTSIFSTVTFPETVVLDRPLLGRPDVQFRSVDPNHRVDCWGRLDSRGFQADFMTGNPETDLRVNYQSSDGVTYTRQDYSTGAGPAPTPFNFGTEIQFSGHRWSAALGKFMILGKATFEGIFEYKKGVWTFAKIGANATADNIWAPAKLYTDKGMVESKTPRAIYSKQNFYVQNTEPETKEGLWITLHNPTNSEYNYSSDKFNISHTYAHLDNDVNLFKPLSKTIPFDFVAGYYGSYRRTDNNKKFQPMLIKNKFYMLYEEKVLGADGSNPWCNEYTLSIYNIDTGELKENVYTFPRTNYMYLTMDYDDRDTIAFRETTSTSGEHPVTRNVFLLDTKTDVVTPKLNIAGFIAEGTTVDMYHDCAKFLKFYYVLVDGGPEDIFIRIINVESNTHKDLHIKPSTTSSSLYELVYNIKSKESHSICLIRRFNDGSNNYFYEYWKIDLHYGTVTPITKTEYDGWEKDFVTLSDELGLYVSHQATPYKTASPIIFGRYHEGEFKEENYMLNIKDVTYSRNMSLLISCFKNNLYLMCFPNTSRDDATIISYNKRIYKLSLREFTREPIIMNAAMYNPGLNLITRFPKHLNYTDANFHITDIVSLSSLKNMDFYIPYDSSDAKNLIKEDTEFIPKNRIKDIYIGDGTKWKLHKSHSVNDTTVPTDLIKLDFSTIKNSWGLSEVIYFKLPESVKNYTYWHLAVNESMSELILYKYNNAAVYKDNNYISEVSQPWDLEIYNFDKEELKFYLDHTYQHSGSSIDGFPVVAANFENYINNY